MIRCFETITSLKVNWLKSNLSKLGIHVEKGIEIAVVFGCI